MKKHFSRHGIPDICLTDNGPQFDIKSFEHFANEWEFEHITSSPHYSQSNGKAESAVKIAKKILKKANRDGKDNWKAILDWRNTPTVDMNSSPVQRLMSRRTRTLLPTTKSHLTSRVADNVKEKIEHKRQKAKYYYDKTGKELQKLDIGDVRARPIIRSEKWKLGETIDIVNSRSYIVDVNGTLYRRNRRDLRKTKEQIQKDLCEPSFEDDQSDMDTHEPTIETNKETVSSPSHKQSAKPDVPTRRSTRTTKIPSKFNTRYPGYILYFGI